LVPLPDGLCGEPDGEVVDGELAGGVVVPAGGDVVVGGDAAGGRSPGRSPIRSLRDSEQPAMRLAPAMNAIVLMSNLFIRLSLLGHGLGPGGKLQAQCHATPVLIH